MRVRKTRTALTAIGIILGVSVILGISITNISTISTFKETIDSITGRADLMITAASADGFTDKNISKISKINGVELAAAGISKGSRLIKGKEKPPIRVIGIDPAVDRIIRDYRIDRGRFLKKSDTPEIIFVHKFAGENRVEIGDTVKLATNKGFSRFRVVGLLDDAGAGRFLNGDVVFMPLKTAQNHYDLKKKLTFIDVIVEEGKAVAGVQKRVRRALGENFVVERPEKRVEAMEETLRALQIGLSFFSAVALFVGGFLIFNTLSMVVIERTREIGVIRSMGATRLQIAGLILYEAFLIGSVASLLGLGAGIGLAKGLTYIMSQTIQSDIAVFEIPLKGLVSGLGVGVFVSLTAALHPALTASRISPLQAVRALGGDNDSKTGGVLLVSSLITLSLGAAVSYNPRLFGFAAGSIFSQIGAFLLLLGAALLTPTFIRPLALLLRYPVSLFARVEGRLASGNLSRSRGRTAATVSAIMISLAMLMSVGGLTDSFKDSIDRWVERSIGADVFVAAEPFDLSINKSYIKRIAAIPGVKEVSPVRFFFVRVGDKTFTFRAIEPKTFRPMADLQFVEGTSDSAWRRLERENALFISTVVADRLKLGSGDSIKIKTNEGPKAFPVAGVIVDFGGETGDVIVGSRTVMKRYFDLDDVNSFRIKTETGAAPKTVAKRIKKRIGDELSLRVEDINEFKSMINTQINVTFAAFNVIILIAIVVAAVGIINTTMMNILERIREIGILRAVGSTKWQIRKTILAEAAMTGAGGFVLGLPLGVYMSINVISTMRALTGYDVDYVFPLQSVALSAAIALIFSTLIALLPAQIAAGTKIIEAVHYE